MLDVLKFRTDFPEFSDITAFPDAQINFWLSLSEKMLNGSRWGDFLDYGRELFTAHNLALQSESIISSKEGAIPGASTGVTTSESVDKVSVSYDQNAGLEPGAGHWNLTVYGKQFIRLSRMVGAGGIQL